MYIKALPIVVMIPALLGAPLHDRRALEHISASGVQTPPSVNGAALHIPAPSQLQGRSQSPNYWQQPHAVGVDTSRRKDERGSIARRAPPEGADPPPKPGPGRPKRKDLEDPGPVHLFDTKTWDYAAKEGARRKSVRLALGPNNDKYMIRGVQQHADYLYGVKRLEDSSEGIMHQGRTAEQKAQLGKKYPLLPETNRAHWDHMAFDEWGTRLSKVHPTGTSKPVPEYLKGPDGKYHFSPEERRKIFKGEEMTFDEKPASPKPA